jgi:ribonuclease E
MVKRMLVDATHLEETRVVVLDGTRLEEFDVETSTKKQIKGNIYLAKVVRVEPSLQAAFVDYGGNRHGFLAFSEIHPDYYQIPVADRERLLAEVDQHREEDESNDSDTTDNLIQENGKHQEENVTEPSDVTSQNGDDGALSNRESVEAIPMAFSPPQISGDVVSDDPIVDTSADATADTSSQSDSDIEIEQAAEAGAVELTVSELGEVDDDASPGAPEDSSELPSDIGESSAGASESSEESADESTNTPVKSTKSSGVETVGGDDDDETTGEDRQRNRFLASRHYKIQEVIKRRQIMLIQVVKEERGSKGAALTSFLSLAGRYCVLMPNSARGGGVSRKITSSQDRRRLKAILGDLELPKSMAVILRTAGAERNKAEIKRDYEYLQRTWNSIREVTMTSRAPAPIHEEASLIKRAIRDIYTRDIEEVWVDGEEGYKTAKDFMKMLTPSHAKKVQKYKDETIPLFHRYQVETQLEAINNPIIQLKSGGSIVFAQTEALVAIDVNSGRSTKERHIEETAYRTNLEAAEEIARQLRLRDLAGLVVIDFIDMEENRNNHAVERRLKEALRADRARIQVGRISHFGLLELSRQRLRPSLIEANFRICSHCSGAGLVRSTESAAVHSLRVLEEEGVRHRSSEVTITVHSDVALYLLNYKRQGLASIETRYGIKIFVLGDNALVPPDMRLDRVKASRNASDDSTDSQPQQQQTELESSGIETVEPQSSENVESHSAPTDEEDVSGRKRRRRRRKKRIGEPRVAGQETQSTEETGSANIENGNDVRGVQNGANVPTDESGDAGVDVETQKSASSRDEQGPRARRRGRRGGRRRRGANVKETNGTSNTDEQSTGSSSNDPVATSDQDSTPQPDSGPPASPVGSTPTVDQGEDDAAMTSTPAANVPDNRSRGPSRLFRTLWKRESEPVQQPATTEPAAPPSQEPTMESPETPNTAPRRGWWQNSDEK